MLTAGGAWWSGGRTPIPGAAGWLAGADDRVTIAPVKLILAVLLPATVLAQASPTLQFRGEQGSKHAAIATPDAAASPGGKLSLFVDVTPKPGIHVYAPGSDDYIPVSVKLEPAAEIKAGKLAYPKAEMMTFASEKVPVFQKPFRLMQEVTILGTLKPGAIVPVKGTVDYQACDDSVCYPPESAPISWSLTVRE